MGAIVERGKFQRQIKLPLSQSLRMCRNSITIRLGRSAVTASGIFLGVAFLCYVMVSVSAIAVQERQEAAKFVVDKDPSVQARAIWLVIMSLLVATLGIVNAMLMAVTERYKEIGTMKCLGALNSFIVRLFLLESGLLGLAGSVSGAVAGLGVAALVYGAKFGFATVAAIGATAPLHVSGHPIGFWWATLGSVVMGTALAVVAALYPAWLAAKMQPAAALRSEI